MIGVKLSTFITMLFVWYFAKKQCEKMRNKTHKISIFNNTIKKLDNHKN